MFISYNEEDLQVPELAINADMATNYCKFMNQLMAEIYELFFQEMLPRVFPEIRQLLQLFYPTLFGEKLFLAGMS